MNIFKKKVRSALSNQILQNALDANSERRVVARIKAFSSLAKPFEDYQKQAHEIRNDVIQNLEHYYQEFVQNVQARGITVHLAKGTSEAKEIALKIAREHNAKLAIKSKSMVSEEVNINQAFEDAGIRVVETDLGEFIIQLRGEHPSHIITPAVHLKREQVGETFQKYLHIPYTNDVNLLTQAARKTLREIFFEADIGISGVNFGVAESGTLCILTNEGNGYMVTTMPSVHIALMGIERILPTLSDLAFMLKLLPRSATGQKITVYTHLIHAPKQAKDADGPKERHLIIVDHGRLSLKNTPLQDALLCIRCGACINACPVFREIGGHSYTGNKGQYTPYPGPIGSIISPALFGENEFGHLAQASTLCGACKEACPVDIDLPNLLLHVRAGGKEIQTHNRFYSPRGLPKSIDVSLRLFTIVMQHPKLLHFVQKTSGVLTQILYPNTKWVPMPSFTGWGYSKDIPKPAIKPFRERWENLKQSKLSPSKPSEFSKQEQRKTKMQTTLAQSFNKNKQSPVEVFQHEITELDGKFYNCTRETLPQTIISIISSYQVKHLCAWNKDPLIDDLLPTLRENNIQVNFGINKTAKIGITRAIAAIAETGSILVTSGDGKNLTTSLLPDIHIAVLSCSDIYPRVEDVITQKDTINASAAVLISGPSRTADIEMTLTIGVHGPQEVIVVCVQ